MNAKKIRLIVEKEFDEIVKNKIVLASILGFPLLFAIFVPLTMIAPALLDPEGLNSSINGSITKMADAGGMSVQEALIVYFVSATLPFFLLLPAMLPTIISSYSIVGEKKNRTLEPLLAAPITVSEIMMGKAVAALIPALAATWIAGGIFALILWLLINGIVHRILVPDLMWAISLLVLAPLLAFMGVMITIVISSRVNDPRTAQQITVVFILPLMALMFLQVGGFFMIDVTTVLALCAIVFVVDAITVKVGSRLFEREEILTRWK